jgi:bifunctional DNase/RNase
MVDEVRVEVWRLVKDHRGRDVVLLRDGRQRSLPIWIGPYEAAAIWIRLDPQHSAALLRRPMTHDLCAAVIQRLGGRVERIVVDDVSNDTYYAKVHLAIDGRTVTVDSRPSDAIALALRCDAPVWVSDAVMEAGNVEVEDDESAAGGPADDAPDFPFEDEQA